MSAERNIKSRLAERKIPEGTQPAAGVEDGSMDDEKQKVNAQKRDAYVSDDAPSYSTDGDNA